MPLLGTKSLRLREPRSEECSNLQAFSELQIRGSKGHGTNICEELSDGVEETLPNLWLQFLTIGQFENWFHLNKVRKKRERKLFPTIC